MSEEQEKPIESPVESSVEPPVDKPVESAVEKSAESPADQAKAESPAGSPPATPIAKSPRTRGPWAAKAAPPKKEVPIVFDENEDPSPFPVIYVPEGISDLALKFESSEGKKGKECKELVGALHELEEKLQENKRVRVVLAFTPYWESTEANAVYITTAVKHKVESNYAPRPSNAGMITYEPQGDPLLAVKIASSLKNSGFTVSNVKNRGLDHGVYVPLKVMFPWSNICVVQVSLIAGMDPAEHYKLGSSLAWLRNDVKGILFMCCGLTYSNFSGFRKGTLSFLTGPLAGAPKNSQAFEQHISDILTAGQDDEAENAERLKQLSEWETHPAALKCHPSLKTHKRFMMPLFVALGASLGKPCTTQWQGDVGEVKQSIFMWP